MYVTADGVNNMDAEEFILRAKQLRARADDAEREFMEFLFEGEKDESIWQGFGMTYLEFIERHGICRASRYARWKKGRTKAEKVLGSGRATSLSFEGVMALGGRVKDEDVPEVVDGFNRWEKTNGTTLTQFAATKITKDTRNRCAVHRQGTPSVSVLEARIDALGTEIEDLKTRVEALKAENRKLKSENKDLKKKNRSLQRSQVEA